MSQQETPEDNVEEVPGFKGELGRAATKMVTAMQSGNAELLVKGMSDHAAALGSQATEAMAATALKLLLRFDQLDQRLDGRDRNDQDWRVELRTQLEEISTFYNREVDKVLATLEEVVAATKKLQDHTNALADQSNDRWEHTLEFEGKSSEDRKRLHEGQGRFQEQLTALSGVVLELKNEFAEYRKGTRRGELDNVIKRLKEIERIVKKNNGESS